MTATTFCACRTPPRLPFKYWEVGNECYGGWETRTSTAARFPGSPQDPYTYAQNFAIFRQKMLAVDPTLHLGAVVISGQDSYGNGQHAGHPTRWTVARTPAGHPWRLPT